MATANDALPSKGEINRCGDYLAAGHELRPGSPEHQEWYDAARIRTARRVVSDYRAAHQRPLGIVSEGLRKIVRSELGSHPVVAQRLKRLPRIVRKLNRMEGTNLARLEDIGGCRAVLPGVTALEAVRSHVESTWGDIIVRRRDYVDKPNAMGYRALHFVIGKNERRIEVQLRTVGQQRWANEIEAADSRLGMTLKDGIGPESMLQYFGALGELFYHVERGQEVPSELNERYDASVDRVVEDGYYSRRG